MSLSRDRARCFTPLFVAIALLHACGGGPDTTGPGLNPPNDNPGGNPGGNPPPAATVSSIAVTPDSSTLAVGDSQLLTAVARSSSGSAVDTMVTWESALPAVASVSATGAVTAIAPGTVTIRAHVGAVAGSARVVVLEPPPTGPAVPEAPSNLQATAERGTVTVTWTDNSTIETGFALERRAASDSAFSQLAMLAADAVAFVDTLINTTDTLTYRIRAVAVDTVSDFASNVAVAPLAFVDVVVQEVAAITSEVLPDPRLPLDGRDLNAELEGLVAQLRTHPEVDTVLHYRETFTVQMVMRDSTSVIIPHNKIPTAAELASAAAMRLHNAQQRSWDPRTRVPSSHRNAVTPVHDPAAVVPGSPRAGVVSIGGGAEVLPTIRTVLREGGYAVSTLGGSVEAMRGYRGLGALYLDSHAAAWLDYRTQAQKFSIETTTKVLKSNRDRYADEVKAGELTFTIVPLLGALQPEGVPSDLFYQAAFAITETFVAKHWQLNDALVALHICFGGAEAFENGLDPTRIRSAILGVGARVIISFDNYVWPTSSLPANAYFFDRLSGANEYPPHVTPQRRPFALGKVEAGMFELGLLSHRRSAKNSPNTTFDFRGDEDVIIGAPSIEQLRVIDDAGAGSGVLELKGTFSETPGTVQVGGAPADIRQWGEQSITVETPFTRTGEVVVEAPGGLKSNEVPLTEWRGGLTLTYRPGLGSLETKMEMDVRFRADAHRVRNEVEREPETEPVTSYLSPLTLARISGSGSYDTGTGTQFFLDNGEARILTAAEVDGGGLFSLTESLFGGEVTIDADDKTLQLCFSINGLARVRVVDADGTDEDEVSAFFIVPQLVDFQRDMMNCLDLQMNDSFRTNADQRVYNAGEGATITLEWTSFTPTSPPGPDTKS